MEISLPIKTEMTTTSIIDDTPIYDKTKRIVYAKDSEYKDSSTAKEVYKRVGDSITPPIYAQSEEATYKVNDVIFKGGVVSKVASIGTSINLKQPWDYTNKDNGFVFNGWSYRYTRLLGGLTSPAFTKVTDDVTHKLYQNGGKWEYSITWELGTGIGWSNDIYEIGTNAYGQYYKDAFKYVENKDPQGNVNARFFTLYVDGVSESHPVTSEPTTGYIVVSSMNGNKKYRVGGLESSSYSGSSSKTLTYAYQVEQNTTVHETQTETNVNVYSSLTPTSDEREAYSYGSGADANSQWLGRTFIFNYTTGDIYMRTHVAIDSEYTETTTPTYVPIESIADFTGYVYYRATDEGLPFDNKRYTFIETTSGHLQIKIKCLGRFDTVAFAGIIAESINVNFLAPNGTTVDSVLGFVPDNTVDDNNNMPDMPTTVILYSKQMVDTGGSIEVNIYGAYIRLGSLLAGAATNAGFSNLTFSNEFIDYSPTEKDQWGNVDYIEGYKANIYTGTVDVFVKNYDKTTRLMTSLGAKEIILNGSSSRENKHPDSTCVFSSTMVVGRLSGFRLETQIDGELMAKMATYSFKIEESV